MSLDSLTDLVSNAVGVLILLLLMTALQSKKQFSDPPLPIEHQSGLVPVFLYVFDEHIQTIDINAVFANGLLSASEVGSEAEYQINADFVGQPDEALTLIVRPVDTTRWPVFNDMVDGAHPLGKTVDAIDSSREFVFLFVHDDGSPDSFKMFINVKQWFLDKGVAVGWIPVTDNNPAYICSWSDVTACRYSPSYYGQTSS